MGQKKELQVLLAACLFAAVTAFITSHLIEEWYEDTSWILLGILGLVVLTSFLATLVCVDIWHLRPADSHTSETLISQYMAFTKLRIKAPFFRQSFYQMTREPARKVITDTLLWIMRLNQETEYGRKCRFSEIHNIDGFIRKVPLTTYENYRSMVERIIAGEQNILYEGDTPFLATTSGTTGRPKLYPLKSKYIKKATYAVEDVIIMNSLIPFMNLKRYFRFHIFSDVNGDGEGIPTGPSCQVIFSFPKHNLIPEEYQKLTTEDQSYYVMAVFAFAEKELSHIDTFSPDLMNSFMKFAVKHWGDICRDIETGTIGKTVKMPEEVRLSLSLHLHADPERADYLRKVLKQEVVGLAKRVWPEMDFIIMSQSAGFKMVATKLMENHFKGIKVIGFGHGGSEGITGVNLEIKHEEGIKEEVATFYPYLCFMEFILLEQVEDQNPILLQLDELEKGKCYEIVVTNENGLNRCRYGDIIKVVGYINNIPKYEFLYRLGQRLNIAYERTPDKFLIEALQDAMSASDTDSGITEFTMTESPVIEAITGQTSKAHYVYFIEFGESLESVSKLAEKIDKNLMESYDLYKHYRDIGSIGDIGIIQVKPGTMETLKGILMGARVNPQFKMPRVLRKEPAIRHLINNRMTT